MAIDFLLLIYCLSSLLSVHQMAVLWIRISHILQDFSILKAVTARIEANFCTINWKKKEYKIKKNTNTLSKANRSYLIIKIMAMGPWVHTLPVCVN